MNAETRAKISRWVAEKSLKDSSLPSMSVPETTTDKIVSSIPASVAAQDAQEVTVGSKVSILTGDCRETLKGLKDGSVHMCVTSPPYWGLRDYGVAGQMGLEPSPEEYVEHLVGVFREVKRVLRDDGTLWLNLGDSYAGGGGFCPTAPSNSQENYSGRLHGLKLSKDRIDALAATKGKKIPTGLKPKDLVGIPWRVAFALQDDGWYLRSDIIWAKGVSGQKDIWQNAYNSALKEGLTEEVAKRIANNIDPYVGGCMPESVHDRPTRSHEYMFLLSKSPKYHYDNEAVKEEAQNWGTRNRKNFRGGTDDPKLKHHGLEGKDDELNPTRNRRSVWTIGTKAYKGAHFATFPPELIRPCILAGCPKQVCSNCGAPWERIMEDAGSVRIREGSDTSGAAAQEVATGTHGDNSIFKTGMKRLFKTTGYKPSCTCNYAYPGCVVPKDDPAYVPYPSVPGTVLDCFGGSGTTGEVAKEEGRNAVLCELNPEYVKLAEKRSGL
jgi:DNA modification methylase